MFTHHGIPTEFRSSVHLFILTAICHRSNPSLSGRALAYRWRSLPRVVVCCCFSHSAQWLPTRKKLLYTVANLALGRLNRGKKEKDKVWQCPPAPPLARCSFGENKKIKITRCIHMSRGYARRRYAGGLGPSRVRTRVPTTRQLGQWALAPQDQGGLLRACTAEYNQPWSSAPPRSRILANDNIKSPLCDRGIATRGCAGGNGYEIVSRCLVERFEQGVASTDICPIREDLPNAQLETFLACMSVPGIPQGQPSYHRALLSTSPVLRLERVIRLRRD